MDWNIGAAIQHREGEGNDVACLAFFFVTFVLAFQHQGFGRQIILFTHFMILHQYKISKRIPF
jgi:hypothetical protein